MDERALDASDRAILNRLQDGMPVCERPFAAVGEELGLDEEALLSRLRRLLQTGVLTRFGPLYQIERAGGAFILAAMRVAPAQVERVAAIVNGFDEVAHNYLRDHRFNLWFVVAAASREQALDAIARIEAQTGQPVYAMPKLKEYFLDLRLPV
jgi:DNA-binding Lrp family transcriptional regulator